MKPQISDDFALGHQNAILRLRTSGKTRHNSCKTANKGKDVLKDESNMKAETKPCRTFEVLKENFISIESPLTRKTALRLVAWLVDGGTVRAVPTRSTPSASSDEDD